MKKTIFIIIAVLLVAAVAVALMAGSSAPAVSMGGIGITEPGATAKLVAGLKAKLTTGKAEIGRTLEAKKSARSFRMKTLLQMHPGHPLETVIEVSCPDRERFTTTIGDRAFHAVRIADKAYVEQQDGTWTVQQTAPTGWSPCGDNPGEPAPWAVMNEGRDPSTVLAKLSANSEITRGAFVSTSAGNCQQWMLNLQMPGGAAHGHGAGGLRYTVCINSTGHLPVAVSMGNGGMVTSYYDWNKPIQIDAPKM
jgi:hypothetical protein